MGVDHNRRAWTRWEKFMMSVVMFAILCTLTIVFMCGCSGETIYETNYQTGYKETRVRFTNDMVGGNDYFFVGVEGPIQHITSVQMQYREQSGDLTDWVDVAGFVYSINAVAIHQNYLWLDVGGGTYYMPSYIRIKVVWMPEEGTNKIITHNQGEGSS